VPSLVKQTIPETAGLTLWPPSTIRITLVRFSGLANDKENLAYADAAEFRGRAHPAGIAGMNSHDRCCLGY
jgi:hypothetical protein